MIEEWAVKLPWLRPPTLANDRRSRGHQSAINTNVKKDAFYCVKRDRVPQLEAIIVQLIWYPGHNGVADSDGLAPTLKYVIDGLVLAKVIPDDDSEYVIASSCRVVKRRNDPFDQATGRTILVIKDASMLAPFTHYAP